MSLSDIAEGVATTRSQQDRGVAVVDRASGSLSTVLEEYASALPCGADQAATLITAYRGGQSVDAAGTAAGVPPVTAAKILYRLGFEGLSPLSPLQRDICRDWLAGDLSRTDAQELVDVGDRAFALGAYIETHDPISGAEEAIEDAQASSEDAMVEKRDALAETMTAANDFL
ncbi:DUF7858 family protein [Halodesulfurarchaeum sp.]|uniref:DUF7858 family protein n=1 Tax=Halodesulfurarchaeum sp. TaxID=1980530 RepID=UPI002FC3697F